MSEEMLCPLHGPYNAALGSCPVCAQEQGGLPGAPQPLNEDDMPTEAFGPSPGWGAGGGYEAGEAAFDDTLPPIGAGGVGGGFDAEKTVLPQQLGTEDRLDETILDHGREEVGLLGWMVVKESPVMRLRRGKWIEVRSGAIWGRDPNKSHILVDDPKVSDLHARIFKKDEEFVIIDLGSKNGTWVNGEEIEGKTVIKQDDEIKMGDTIFVLKTLE